MGAGEILRPRLRVLPVGWAWALYFAQGVVSERARRPCVDGDRQLLRDKRPAPLLRPGRPLAAVYVDNFTGVGDSAADAESGARAFEARAAAFRAAARSATPEQQGPPRANWPRRLGRSPWPSGRGGFDRTRVRTARSE